MTARPDHEVRPAAELVITDVEQLKAMSDPLRLQLLDLMSDAPIRTWTARELAERLATKQTKLYHHLGMLEERGFIRVAETRMVSGILEKRYAVTALSFRLDRFLLTGPGGEGVVARVLDAVFEKARSEIVAGVRAGLIDMDTDDPVRRRMVLLSAHARLRPASVQKVLRQIEKLNAMDRVEDPDGTEYGMVLGFYPRTTAGEQDR